MRSLIASVRLYSISASPRAYNPIAAMSEGLQDGFQMAVIQPIEKESRHGSPSRASEPNGR